MIRSARNFLAGGFLLLTLPAAHAEAALSAPSSRRRSSTARDYADDRSLIFYCLRGSTETVPFLYAGLQADIEQAVQKMKSAGASARQSAEMVQMVLGSVRYYRARAKDDSLDRRCISKDVERSRAEVKGVSVPLFLPPPFDKLGKQVAPRCHEAARLAAISLATRRVRLAEARLGARVEKSARHKRPYGPTARPRGRALFCPRPYCGPLSADWPCGQAVPAGAVAGAGAGVVTVRSCAGNWAWSVRRWASRKEHQAGRQGHRHEDANHQ